MNDTLFAIELTPDEIALADAINFDPRTMLGNTHGFHANGDLVVRLTNRLLSRKAIPDQRLSYFSDPEYNIGGRGKSRRDLFLRHGHDDDSLMRHGHFLKYLRYFIHGADLPESVVQAFVRTAKDCGPITSGDIAPLSASARQLARTQRLEPKAAADEFFKLCLDLGMSVSNAASIRGAVLQYRPRP